MRRTRINCYLDVIVTHPELTPEERERLIEEEEKKSKELTEWEDIR